MIKCIPLFFLVAICFLNVQCQKELRRTDLDALVDTVRVSFSGRNNIESISLRTALKVLNGTKELKVSKGEIYGLYLAGSSELTDQDLKNVSKGFPNICVVIEGDNFLNNNSDKIDLSIFKEIRAYYALGYSSQGLVNSVLKCPHLKYFRAEHDVTSFNFPKNPLDTIPNYIGDLKELEFFSLSPYEFDVTKLPPDNSGNALYYLGLGKEDRYRKHVDVKKEDVFLKDLPEGFGKLPLKKLQLYGFSSGKLPACIGKLEQLEELILIGHNFDSGLEHLGGLENLKRLTLDLGASSGKLTDSFSNLTNLEYLYLRWEAFTGFPNSIDNLESLKYLEIQRACLLKELPASFGQLSQLEKLKIDECFYLRKLPSFEGMNSLRKLQITNSGVSNFPIIGSNNSLEQVFIENCPIAKIDETIGNAKKLNYLRATKTHLNYTSPKIGKAKKLEYLYIQSSDSPITYAYPEITYHPANGKIDTEEEIMRNYNLLPVELGDIDSLKCIYKLTNKDAYNIMKRRKENGIDEILYTYRKYRSPSCYYYLKPLDEEKLSKHHKDYEIVKIKEDIKYDNLRCKERILLAEINLKLDIKYTFKLEYTKED